MMTRFSSIIYITPSSPFRNVETAKIWKIRRIPLFTLIIYLQLSCLVFIINCASSANFSSSLSSARHLAATPPHVAALLSRTSYPHAIDREDIGTPLSPLTRFFHPPQLERHQIPLPPLYPSFFHTPPPENQDPTPPSSTSHQTHDSPQSSGFVTKRGGKSAISSRMVEVLVNAYTPHPERKHLLFPKAKYIAPYMSNAQEGGVGPLRYYDHSREKPYSQGTLSGGVSSKSAPPPSCVYPFHPPPALETEGGEFHLGFRGNSENIPSYLPSSAPLGCYEMVESTPYTPPATRTSLLMIPSRRYTPFTPHPMSVHPPPFLPTSPLYPGLLHYTTTPPPRVIASSPGAIRSLTTVSRDKVSHHSPHSNHFKQAPPRGGGAPRPSGAALRQPLVRMGAPVVAAALSPPTKPPLVDTPPGRNGGGVLAKDDGFLYGGCRKGGNVLPVVSQMRLDQTHHNPPHHRVNLSPNRNNVTLPPHNTLMMVSPPHVPLVPYGGQQYFPPPLINPTTLHPAPSHVVLSSLSYPPPHLDSSTQPPPPPSSYLPEKPAASRARYEPPNTNHSPRGGQPTGGIRKVSYSPLFSSVSEGVKEHPQGSSVFNSGADAETASNCPPPSAASTQGNLLSMRGESLSPCSATFAQDAFTSIHSNNTPPPPTSTPSTTPTLRQDIPPPPTHTTAHGASTSSSSPYVPESETPVYPEPASAPYSEPIRIGHGYDIHRLCVASDQKREEQTGGRGGFVLCGVTLPKDLTPLTLVAHSDGDVVFHSVCDAIFGALCLPDIGQQFPDRDPRWRGASSDVFLGEALRQMKTYGYEVGNLDITVILEKPKLADYKKMMMKRLEEVMKMVGRRKLNLKFRTHEKCDSVGRNEAVECHCVVVLKKG